MPDWADLLAAQWMDAIKATYSEKGLGKDKIYAPIVNIQGQAFATGINGIYKDVDFDTPDWFMREVLKRNTWQFSIAKNYNDCIAISNALIDENGALRSWNDFKKEAQKIAGDSVKYLKTEYNTIVGGAQMSRLWNDIQRDKAIFPLAQFVVVKDGRTSDICAPLDGVIVSVDDPMLAYYFPLNHFNCRTTVKRLRRGKITDKYELPDIPEAFRNNVGKTGEIFTKDNAYIKNTPDNVLRLSDGFYNTNNRNERYKDVSFKQKKTEKGVLEMFTTGRQNANEFKPNKEAFNILAKNGYEIRMLPVINDGGTNPDGFNRVTKNYMDVKAAQGTNGKNIMQSALKEASRQNAAELVIYLKQKPDSYRAMYDILKTTIFKNRSKNVSEVIVIYPDKSIKTYSVDRIRNFINKKGSNLT